MYAKIFTSLFDGSMRGRPNLILVFINLLCHADEDGIVDRHWQAIIDETGLSKEQVQTSLRSLETPDTQSRSRNKEGRRITRLDDQRDWGWQIVNYQHYRNLRTAEERREYMRKYMAERRCKQNVNTCKQPLAKLANVDVDVNVDIDIPPKPPKRGKLKKEQLRRMKVQKNTELMIAIGKWFGRAPTTLWSLYEAEALKELLPITPEDNAALAKYYTAEIPKTEDYRRKNVVTLLNNWQGEIDRARGHKPDMQKETEQERLARRERQWQKDAYPDSPAQ